MKKFALAGLLACLLHSMPSAQTQIWDRDMLGPVPRAHVFEGLAAGDNGSVWTGERIFDLSVTFRIQRYDANGNLLLSTSPLDPNGNSYQIGGISSDGAGGIYFVGTTVNPSDDNFANGRLDASGQVLWFSQLLGNSGVESAFDTVSDGAGGNFAVGVTRSGASSGKSLDGVSDALVTRYDSSGNLIWGWSAGLNGHHTSLLEAEQDGAGGVIAVGERFAGFARTTMAVRVTPSRIALWEVELPGAPSPSDIASDDFGGVAFVGGTGPDGWVGHLDSSGVLDWTTTLPQITYASAILHLPNGEWLVTGSDSPFGVLNQIVLVRLSPSGALVSTTVLDEVSSPRPEVTNMLLSSDGSLILGGTRLAPLFQDYRGWLGRVVLNELSTPRCAGTPNSTGSSAITAAHGSPLLGDRRLTLYATGLPAQTTAFFISSQTVDSVPNPGGAHGVLCLGGSIGRFSRPGEVLQADSLGRIHLGIDPSDFPIPTGAVSVMSGEEWHFQAWYRDMAPAAGSNFSSSASIVFQ